MIMLFFDEYARELHQLILRLILATYSRDIAPELFWLFLLLLAKLTRDHGHRWGGKAMKKHHTI